jgi:prevent-host-death family protein
LGRKKGAVMRKVGLFEAKQKLSELVERASRGERIGITRRGKLAAEIVPAREGEVDIKEVFASMERIRKRAKPLPRGVTVKDLIEEGRM